MNSKFTWHDERKLVSSKVSKNIFFTFKIRYDLSFKILLLLCRVLDQPYFDYCIIIWASQNNYHFKSFHRQQKKALRLIAFAKWDARTKSLFKKLGALTIFYINMLTNLLFCL